MTTEIGIGFVGAGHNTRLRHLPGFASIPGVRRVTVANRTEATSVAVAEAFDIDGVAANWQTVVADPQVHAICIGTWPNLHAEVAIAALKAGKHVLTEARMAATLGQAEEMLTVSRQHPDRVAQIVPSPFTLDLDSTIIGLIRSGEIGDALEILIDYATDIHLDPDKPLTWRQDRDCSGVNILTLGIFQEAVERWFPDAMLVSEANGLVHIKERIHWETGEKVPVEVPDYLHVLGFMERGTLLNYRFSSVESGPGRNLIKLVGSKATLRVDIAGQRLLLSKPGQDEVEVPVPPEERRGWRVEEDFIASIREGRPVELTSFEAGVRYMSFTDAVYRRLGCR